MPGVVILLILLGYLTWRDWGFSWMTVWWLWLLILPWPLLVVWGFAGLHMSAGADWLNFRGSFIKTYELVSVEVTTGAGGSYYLDIKDRDGREVSAQTWILQQNRELWDLVYNGILHSVHRGHAETNRRAQDHLQLMYPPTVTSP